MIVFNMLKEKKGGGFVGEILRLNLTPKLLASFTINTSQASNVLTLF